jgi:hypothetical protein
MPRAPTTTEIHTACAAIVKDGPRYTGALGRAIATTSEQWLKTFLEDLPKPVSAADIAFAAMTYGLNLGIRIGDARTY